MDQPNVVMVYNTDHTINTLLIVGSKYAIMARMTDKPSKKKASPSPLQVRLDQDMLDKLDDLRRGRADFATRSDIIRELIEAAHSSRKRS